MVPQLANQRNRQHATYVVLLSHTVKICSGTNEVLTYFVSVFRHRKTHDPKDNFKCEVCGKAFARNENLQNHIQQAHSESSISTSSIQKTNIPVLDLSGIIKTDGKLETAEVSYICFVQTIPCRSKLLARFTNYFSRMTISSSSL